MPWWPRLPGVLPADRLDGIITTRGQYIIVVGRSSIAGPEDLAPLHQVQDGMRLSLSERLGTEPPPAAPPVDFLAWDDDKAAGLGVSDRANQHRQLNPRPPHG